MNDSFIGNEKYDQEVFSQVLKLSKTKNWKDIDDFLLKEYRLKWLNYRKRVFV